MNSEDIDGSPRSRLEPMVVGMGMGEGLVITGAVTCYEFYFPGLPLVWLAGTCGVAWMAWHAVSIPYGLFPVAADWPGIRFRLRISAMLTAGLYPFGNWWWGDFNSLYYFVNAMALLVATAFFLFYASGFVRFLYERFEPGGHLAIVARITRRAMIYLVLGPVLAFVATSLFSSRMRGGEGVFIFFLNLRPALILVFCVPPMFLTFLLLALRFRTTRH